MKDKLKEYGVLALLIICLVVAFMALALNFRDLFAMIWG